MTEIMTDEQTSVDTTTNPIDTDNGDHDRMSHYVRKDALERALFDGIPTTALCGKKWLPTRDASKFPVCPECKDRYEAKNDDTGDIPNT